MTDNAKNYVLSRDFQAALSDRAQERIRPYRHQANGKVERFNRTVLPMCPWTPVCCNSKGDSMAPRHAKRVPKRVPKRDGVERAVLERRLANRRPCVRRPSSPWAEWWRVFNWPWAGGYVARARRAPVGFGQPTRNLAATPTE